MREASAAKVKEAVSWLLLAYSLGHSDTCECDHCPNARETASAAKGKTFAA